MAEITADDSLIIDGFSGQLIPQTITHTLRVCLIADIAFRLEQAQAEKKLSKKDATQAIRNAEEERSVWMNDLFRTRDPWDPSFYDIVIPTDKMDINAVVRLIEENLRSEVILPTDSSRRAAGDFMLASRVGVALRNNFV